MNTRFFNISIVEGKLYLWSRSNFVFMPSISLQNWTKFDT